MTVSVLADMPADEPFSSLGGLSRISTTWRPPVLKTDRLILRPFAEGDAAPLFVHASNPRITRYTLWEHHESIADTLLFVRDYAHCRYLEQLPEPYAVIRRDDPESLPVGCVGCYWTSMPNRTMELGYWIAETYWGQGLAAESCLGLLTHVFPSYEPERIQARVIVGNEQSVRVLSKLGFRHEGTLRSSLFRRDRFEDVMYFSLLRSEWQPAVLGQSFDPSIRS